MRFACVCALCMCALFCRLQDEAVVKIKADHVRIELKSHAVFPDTPEPSLAQLSYQEWEEAFQPDPTRVQRWRRGAQTDIQGHPQYLLPDF